MDWFERLTGFKEKDYEETRRKLEVDGRCLRSTVNGRSCQIGELELVSLADMRERVAKLKREKARSRVKNVVADVRWLHRDPRNAGALFQVASQFNFLEMTGPSRTPEEGVGIYEYDLTQGPACAISAGAATIYRNYFAPVGGLPGQTRDRQLDGLYDLGLELSRHSRTSLADLWTMRNGYALCTEEGLSIISSSLLQMSSAEWERLKGFLRIGVHRDVEVTEGTENSAHLVTQAFCSALPVAYCQPDAIHWEPFAVLVLEAAYEATLWAGVLNMERGGSSRVFLTRLGGGAFGNEAEWIDAAMSKAMHLACDFGLDVVLVSHDEPNDSMLELEAEYK